MFTRTLMACTLMALSVGAIAADSPPASKVTEVFNQPLPNVPGKSMRVVEVDYAPGAASPSHRHPKTAFIYATVIEGEISSAVNGEPARTFKAGESWSESPGDFHGVSANASKTKPARLKAVFVLDSSETQLVTPADK
ncbi:cupin domain-containing protein [Pseudomonas sp. PSKL.D1]|uniref:cupin domain-containing protein n=1 Tax=Pseudomonas sp. PSKL.D1 TaxID=3029060 RepID=UPI00238158B0|nr:cupin domain-containing protein [Pseudomonas sp. PSKL.D1]WDY60448.1 cupin domain-containing protein [Pseudomonas sp. PSKL.D1]